MGKLFECLLQIQFVDGELLITDPVSVISGLLDALGVKQVDYSNMIRCAPPLLTVTGGINRSFNFALCTHGGGTWISYRNYVCAEKSVCILLNQAYVDPMVTHFQLQAYMYN